MSLVLELSLGWQYILQSCIRVCLAHTYVDFLPPAYIVFETIVLVVLKIVFKTQTSVFEVHFFRLQGFA